MWLQRRIRIFNSRQCFKNHLFHYQMTYSVGIRIRLNFYVTCVLDGNSRSVPFPAVYTSLTATGALCESLSQGLFKYTQIKQRRILICVYNNICNIMSNYSAVNLNFKLKRSTFAKIYIRSIFNNNSYYLII